LEAALKGVFNRVLKNLRKASTITDLARHQKRSLFFCDFPDARNAAAITGCRRAHRLRRTRTLSVTQANMARKHAQQLWCGLCSRALPSRCVRPSKTNLAGRLCHARQRPSLCVVKSARKSAHSYQLSTQVRTHARGDG